MKHIIFLFFTCIVTLLAAQCPVPLIEADTQEIFDSLMNANSGCSTINKIILNGSVSNIDRLQGGFNIGSLQLNSTNIDSIYFPNSTVFHFFGENNYNLQYVNLPTETPTGSIYIFNNPKLDTLIKSTKQFLLFELGSGSGHPLKDSALVIIPNDSVSVYDLTIAAKHRVICLSKMKVTYQIELYKSDYYKSFTDLSTIATYDSINSIGVFNFDENTVPWNFDTKGSEAITQLNGLGFIGYDTINLDGFKNCNGTFNGIYIENNDNIVDLEKLHSVKVKHLSLNNLSQLQTLDGQLNLPYLQKMTLEDNPLLHDIDVLEGAGNLEYIKITNNPSLPYCSYKPICHLLSSANPSEVVEIMGNLDKCLDNQTVAQECIVDVIEAQNELWNVSYSNGQLTFHSVDNQQPLQEVRLFDTMGRMYLHVDEIKEASTDINLLPGCYFITFTHRQQRYQLPILVWQ